MARVKHTRSGQSTLLDDQTRHENVTAQSPVALPDVPRLKAVAETVKGGDYNSQNDAHYEPFDVDNDDEMLGRSVSPEDRRRSRSRAARATSCRESLIASGTTSQQRKTPTVLGSKETLMSLSEIL